MQSFCGHIYTGRLGKHLISDYVLSVHVRGYFAGSPNFDDKSCRAIPNFGRFRLSSRRHFLLQVVHSSKFWSKSPNCRLLFSSVHCTCPCLCPFCPSSVRRSIAALQSCCKSCQYLLRVRRYCRYNLANCLVSHCGLSVFQIEFRLCRSFFVVLSVRQKKLVECRMVSHFARAVCDRVSAAAGSPRAMSLRVTVCVCHSIWICSQVTCRLCGPSCRAWCRRWKRCACNG